VGSATVDGTWRRSVGFMRDWLHAIWARCSEKSGSCVIILLGKPRIFALSVAIDGSQWKGVQRSAAHRFPAGSDLPSAQRQHHEIVTMSTQHSAEAAALAAKINGVRIAMFTWQDQHGHLLSQPMTRIDTDDAGGIWFYTSTLTTLWECIGHRPEVNLGFADQEHSLYVSVSGTAERVVDRNLIRAKWNTFVQAWFPAGPEDEHAVLLRVDPHSAEYWDSNDSKMVRMFAMAKAAITGDKPDMDSEHGTLKL
jgi:general stress protein 26